MFYLEKMFNCSCDNWASISSRVSFFEVYFCRCMFMLFNFLYLTAQTSLYYSIIYLMSAESLSVSSVSFILLSVLLFSYLLLKVCQFCLSKSHSKSQWLNSLIFSVISLLFILWILVLILKYFKVIRSINI